MRKGRRLEETIDSLAGPGMKVTAPDLRRFRKISDLVTCVTYSLFRMPYAVCSFDITCRNLECPEGAER